MALRWSKNCALFRIFIWGLSWETTLFSLQYHLISDIFMIISVIFYGRESLMRYKETFWTQPFKNICATNFLHRYSKILFVFITEVSWNRNKIFRRKKLRFRIQHFFREKCTKLYFLFILLNIVNVISREFYIFERKCSFINLYAFHLHLDFAKDKFEWKIS